MLDTSRIRAITFDLDDTLWPIWPTIERAEKVLTDWLCARAPMTAALFADAHARHDIRQQVLLNHPDIAHDLSAVRLEAIRLTLKRAGDDPSLAEPAFEAFFAERNRVVLFEDVLPALDWLARRYPLVAISNGNADLVRVGLAAYFKGGISASRFGVAKPHASIFQAGATMAGVAVHQVLHVGDDAHHDVIGAMEAGMQAVWVNRAEHLWTDTTHQPHDSIVELGELCDLLSATP